MTNVPVCCRLEESMSYFPAIPTPCFMHACVDDARSQHSLVSDCRVYWHPLNEYETLAIKKMVTITLI